MHRVPFEEFYKRLNLTEDIVNTGLNTSDAIQRNIDQGDNRLTEKEKAPWYMLLIHELTSFFALLLWTGAILCIFSYILDTSDPSNLYLGVVLAVVVFVTGVVTFF